MLRAFTISFFEATLGNPFCVVDVLPTRNCVKSEAMLDLGSSELYKIFQILLLVLSVEFL